MVIVGYVTVVGFTVGLLAMVKARSSQSARHYRPCLRTPTGHSVNLAAPSTNIEPPSPVISSCQRMRIPEKASIGCFETLSANLF